jgi:hypothetical protein
LPCSRDCILGRHEFQDPTNIGSNVHPVWSFSFIFFHITWLNCNFPSQCLIKVWPTHSNFSFMYQQSFIFL